jgi:hypothetical protein
MQGYVIHLHICSRTDRLVALFAGTVIFLLTSCVGSNSDFVSSISDPRDPSAAGGKSIAEGIQGPTILLGYSREGVQKNPISSFMYFVPLIAPTQVDRETSAENEQQMAIISYSRKVTSESFRVVCEFEIVGKGFHKNTFDSKGMIETHTDALEKGEVLTKKLDYIKFEGEGIGCIEVKGTMAGSAPTVTEVDLKFNARGRKSPVTIGLYDVKPKDGHYQYENRSNEVIARVNSLIFKKTQTIPRMGMKLASVSATEESAGFFSGLTAVIANLFISPTEISKLGNETMLDFGYALLEQKPAFTFPRAENIKENKIVEADPIQK